MARSARHERYAGLKLERELNTSFAILCEHGAGKPEFRVIGGWKSLTATARI
jgi:hypothetical protein